MRDDLVTRLTTDENGYEHQDPIWETRQEAATEITRLREQLAEAELVAKQIADLLMVPEAVHHNILIGKIAKPTWDRMITLYPEAERQRDAARAAALEDAAGIVDRHRGYDHIYIPGSFWDTLHGEIAAAIRALIKEDRT